MVTGAFRLALSGLAMAALVACDGAAFDDEIDSIGEALSEDGSASFHVPEDFPTIQDAVTAAEPGDKIFVGRGEFCGAALDKELRLYGDRTTIVGCPEPTVNDGLRAGFVLGEDASGSSIKGFRFDGEGVSNANLDPLAFAIHATRADDVSVRDNGIFGTAQAITNSGGSGWRVLGNRIVGQSALTCEPGGRCGGGVGIVFQQRDPAEPRATDNQAHDNRFRTVIPDGMDEFVMVGLFVQGQSCAMVNRNRTAIEDNPIAAAFGVGVLVTDNCCADPPLPTSVDTRILRNKGVQADFAVFVTDGNLQGLVALGNRGEVVIGGQLPPLEPPGPDLAPQSMVAAILE